MPRYFIGAAGNYYETLTDVAVRPGHLAVPQRPDPHAAWSAATGEWEAGTPPPPTPEMVNGERDRRIYKPKLVDPGIGVTFSVDMAGGGRENVANLVQEAFARILAEEIDPIEFRDADNIDRELTPAQVVAMGRQMVEQVRAIHGSAKVLKAMDPIPADYADESHWGGS